MTEKGLAILDALENLNAVMDVDSLEELEVTEDSLLVAHKEQKPEEYWLQAGADEQTAEVIRETFRSVHAYLQTFYQRMKGGGEPRRLVEGINTVMVLVGEATKKIDRLGLLFKERVSDFSEYRNLQDFYRNKVIREIFQDFAKAPVKPTQTPKEERALQAEMEGLLTQDTIEEVAGVHILNDLGVIQRDHLYELFYLKNEAGHDFYSFELARNIKLACNFGEFSGEYFGEDPLLQVKNWEDRALHLLARNILKECHVQVEKFYREAMRYREMEIVALVHNSVMALMLAGNPRNLIRQFSAKGAHHYFHDFQLFLRAVLTNREYQRFQVYGAPDSKPFFKQLMALVSSLVLASYTLGPDRNELKGALQELITREHPHKEQKLSDQLVEANKALAHEFAKHPSGPVFKALDLIRDEQPRVFDPLMQGNMPEVEVTLVNGEKRIHILRMAAPISQQLIHKAAVTEEFHVYLHALEGSHLLVNLQDRTSWKEHARCLAVEELARQAEFASVLTVVTLAQDTDFFNQCGMYKELDDAKGFVDHLLHHLADESTGYYFPSEIKKRLFPQFMQQLVAQVHITFFDHKANLSYIERLDFLSLVYRFIELKLIEITQPTFMSLTSKDGLDVTAVETVGLIALLARGEPLDVEQLTLILFGATVMQRERVIHPERFDRLASLLRLIEAKASDLSPFAHLFDEQTLNWRPQI